MRPPLELTVALSADAIDALADAVAARLHEGRGDQRDAADDRWLTTREAAGYLGMTVAALHKLTAARAIPFEQAGPGCRCYFRRADLDRWRAF